MQGFEGGSGALTPQRVGAAAGDAGSQLMLERPKSRAVSDGGSGVMAAGKLSKEEAKAVWKFSSEGEPSRGVEHLVTVRRTKEERWQQILDSPTASGAA